MFSGEKDTSFSFIPVNGNRSAIFVPSIVNFTSGIPSSGDRLATFVPARFSAVSFMPFSGDKSDTGV